MNHPLFAGINPNDSEKEIRDKADKEYIWSLIEHLNNELWYELCDFFGKEAMEKYLAHKKEIARENSEKFKEFITNLKTKYS